MVFDLKRMRAFKIIIACGRASIKEKSITSRIAGGYEVTPHSIPWQAHLIIKTRFIYNGEYMGSSKSGCGGSLISPRNVLSAAHCVDMCDHKCEVTCRTPCKDSESEACETCMAENMTFGGDPSSFTVILGAHETSCGATTCDGEENIVTDGIEVPVCSISVPPGLTIKNLYRPIYLNNDFTIVWLTRPVVFNDKISPVCLPTPNMSKDFFVRKSLTVSGWGQGSMINGKNILMAVKLPGVSNEVCWKDNLDNGKYWPDVVWPNVTENMLCAGEYPIEDKTVCPGDSGGSLYLIQFV